MVGLGILREYQGKGYGRSGLHPGPLICIHPGTNSLPRCGMFLGYFDIMTLWYFRSLGAGCLKLDMNCEPKYIRALIFRM